MHIMQIQDINKTQSTTGMLFPKSKIQSTEYEDARKKKDRDHMGQIVLLVVKKLKRLCYITYVRTISSANDI